MDACQGDSGGPLMNGGVTGQERYTLLGLVSFGPRTCGVSNFPGVYTRISAYMDWIMDNMQIWIKLSYKFLELPPPLTKMTVLYIFLYFIVPVSQFFYRIKRKNQKKLPLHNFFIWISIFKIYKIDTIWIVAKSK